MRKCLVIIFLLSTQSAFAQDILRDSLRRSLLVAKEDTAKLALIRELAYQYLYTKPDTSLFYYRHGLTLAKSNNLTKWEVMMLTRIGRVLAQFPAKKDSALVYMQQAIALAKQNYLFSEEVDSYVILSDLYFNTWKKTDSAFLILKEGMKPAQKSKSLDDQTRLEQNLINFFVRVGKPDSALQVCFDGLLTSQKKNLPAIESFYFNQISNIFFSQPVDSLKMIKDKAVAWARKNEQKKYEGYFLFAEGHRYVFSLRYSEAFRSLLASIKIFEAIHAEQELASALNDVGDIYFNLAEYRHGLSYYSRGALLQEKLIDSFVMIPYQRMGFSYAKLKMHDSAVYFAKKCYAIAERFDRGSKFKYFINDVAEIYAEVEEDSIAMLYFRRSLPYYEPGGFDSDDHNRTEVFAGIAKLFRKAGQNDSAFFYARLALTIGQPELAKGISTVRLIGFIYESSKIISDYYQSKNRLDSAFAYREIEIAAKDSLSGQEKLKEIQAIEFNEELRQQQAKEDVINYRNKVNTYFFASGSAAFILIVIFLYRNNRLKQKANLVLQQQKQKVEDTLEQLRSTQAQLVQSEKMASLGELTAGIAHEIQNPLNFVNNFSDVNKELVEEAKAELATGNLQSAGEILNDIKDNSEKINHHGKRADAIVKGMLQHSRTSSGQKEPTDLNALADEYLRLAFHGMRAKDKSFNAKTETGFDNSIGRINVNPQEIGRVILNLINNAFYAVSEKQKQNLNARPDDPVGRGYEPTVTVSSAKNNGKVEIRVKDNGNGIPQKVLDKIFQPFFTTKPTGQGTGLGLSLAYDIVKAHGGELKVETKEGEGSEFIIQLTSA